KMRGGMGTMNISYKGPIAKNNNTNSFLNGVITFNKGLLLYAPRDVELTNVNGRIVFKSSDVFVENIQAEVLNTKIVMEGEAKNLLTLISTEPNKAIINWSVYTTSINSASFAYLLRPRKKTITVVTDNNNALERSARQIDEVLERGSVNVSLKADRLIYKKFDANNAVAYISLLHDSYIIHKVSMEHAGGQMDINGSLQSQKENYHQAKVSVNMNNVDVSKTLAAFDNFGQDGITSESLKGKLTSQINATIGLDNDGNAHPGTLEGVVDFSLKEGALINYEPIKKLQNFLFKNRDFENIKFAELKNRLEVKGDEVKVNRMEIQSSILSMFIEGTYSMKGTTDLSIQVPLSNLKGRDSTFVPENIGTDKTGGRSVFVRGRPGKDGNVEFKLDLFNRFRKDKNEEEEKKVDN
ncbi:MAG TPA: AsmA-like C-terminal region-containing protein, partial [Segetibacter sp.]